MKKSDLANLSVQELQIAVNEVGASIITRFKLRQVLKQHFAQDPQVDLSELIPSADKAARVLLEGKRRGVFPDKEVIHNLICVFFKSHIQEDIYIEITEQDFESIFL